MENKTAIIKRKKKRKKNMDTKNISWLQPGVQDEVRVELRQQWEITASHTHDKS